MYNIKIAQSVEKKLNKIGKKDKERIIEKIDSLASIPRPEDCKKLQGRQSPPLYRIRSGKYRVIYAIQDQALIILILDVGHRKDIYKN